MHIVKLSHTPFVFGGKLRILIMPVNLWNSRLKKIILLLSDEWLALLSSWIYYLKYEFLHHKVLNAFVCDVNSEFEWNDIMFT
jgi:hypothetical protein